MFGYIPGKNVMKIVVSVFFPPAAKGRARSSLDQISGEKTRIFKECVL